jgi:CubicO group peptidase (beta-lactamase class C family)
MPLNAEELAQFEAYALEAMELAGVPGMAIAIVQHGEVSYARGFGVRELGSNTPVTADTLMMIASVSKALTSVMMATVVDDGLMGWDTPVTSVLPAFSVGDPELTEDLAMRHLICACSGMPGKDAALFISGMDRAEEMINTLRFTEPVAILEKQFNYSNTMFAAGGYLAGLAAGGPANDLDAGYISAMQERVFDPVGMTNTTVSVDLVENSDNLALPHGLDLANQYQPMPLSAEDFVLSVKPAGAIWSTANDMAQLLLTLLNEGVSPEGERVVSAENLQELWQPGVVVAGGSDPVHYGLGWFIEDFAGTRIISHSGGSMGFSADFVLVPQSDVGIVILTNGESASDFVYNLRRRFLELAVGLEGQQDAEFRGNLESREMAILDFAGRLQPGFDEEAMTPYLGRFSNPEIGDITISNEEGKLSLSGRGLTSELRQLSGTNETILTVSDIPLTTLGQLIFQLKLDSKGEPIILLHEKMVSRPYEFEKVMVP